MGSEAEEREAGAADGDLEGISLMMDSEAGSKWLCQRGGQARERRGESLAWNLEKNLGVSR